MISPDLFTLQCIEWKEIFIVHDFEDKEETRSGYSHLSENTERREEEGEEERKVKCNNNGVW